MKKVILASLLATLMLGGLLQRVWSKQSWTDTTRGAYRNAKVQMITCTFDNDLPYTNMNNLTLTTGHVHGLVTRISADSTGTDTQWDLVLKDSIGNEIFSKTDCNSSSEPFSYMIYEDDTEGNPWLGIPVSDYLAIDIDNVAQQDEVQTWDSDTDATEGTWEITVGDYNTTPMAYNANTAAIKAALEVLANIDTDGITSVSGTLDDSNTNPIIITFADSLGNVPLAVYDTTEADTNGVLNVETTEGGNLLTELIIYIWYEQ